MWILPQKHLTVLPVIIKLSLPFAKTAKSFQGIFMQLPYMDKKSSFAAASAGGGYCSELPL